MGITHYLLSLDYQLGRYLYYYNDIGYIIYYMTYSLYVPRLLVITI